MSASYCRLERVFFLAIGLAMYTPAEKAIDVVVLRGTVRENQLLRFELD
jgi:hypothetical protein